MYVRSKVSFPGLVAALLFAILVSWIGISSSPLLAYAADGGGKNLELSFSSDRASYEESDIATLDLSITNNTGESHHDVIHDFDIPEGLELVDATTFTKENHGDLQHGETLNVSLKLKLSKTSPSNASPSADVDAGNMLAQTGDEAPVALLVLLICIAAVAVFSVKRRQGGRLLSALLVVSLAAGGLVVPKDAFAAQDATPHRSDDALTLDYDGTEYVVGVVVSSHTKTKDNNGSGSNDNDVEQDSGGTTPGITYQDDVIVVGGEYWTNRGTNADAFTILVSSAYPESIEVGDKIAAEPNDENPFGIAFVVVSVEEVEAGVLIRGLQPEMDDIIKSIYANGTSDSDVRFKPSDNVEIDNGEETSGVFSAQNEIAAFSLLSGVDWSGTVEASKITVKLKDQDLSFSFKPSLDYAIDYRIGDLRELKLIFNLEQKVKTSVKLKNEVEIPIGELYFPTEVPSIWIKGEAVGKISLSGEISFSVKNVTTLGFQYKNDDWKWVADNSSSAEVGFDAALKASLDISAGVTILGCLDLGEVGLEGGFSYEPDSPVIRDTGMICLDMVTSFESSLKVSAVEGLITNSVDLVGEELGRMHFEDTALVKECTWKEEEAPDPEEPGDEGLESDKYEETPQFNSGAYGDRLVEPFNINAGKSMQFGAVGASTTIGSSWWFINYDCAPGTIFKMTKMKADGTTEESLVNAFVGFGTTNNRCAGEPVLIEVFLGRVTVTSLYAYSAPPCTAGVCETVDYPLHISDASLALKVGEERQLIVTDDFESITGAEASYGASWNSSNSGVAKVVDGKVTAVGEGVATITCAYGDFYKVKCKVTVS